MWESDCGSEVIREFHRLAVSSGVSFATKRLVEKNKYFFTPQPNLKGRAGLVDGPRRRLGRRGRKASLMLSLRHREPAGAAASLTKRQAAPNLACAGSHG